VATQFVLKMRRVHENPMAVPVSAFVGALAVWAFYGLVSGGVMTVALWELRALAYLCLLVFLVPQVISSERDVRLLLWVAIATVATKAAQGAWNYAVILGGDLRGVRSVTGHEDALFIGWMFVLLLALLVNRAAPAQRAVLLAASPLMAFTFVVTDRRAAFVALAIGVAVLVAIVATDRTKRALLVSVCVPVLLAGSFVTLAGWNSAGPLGAPARAIKSIYAPDSKEDVDSSYYRRAEEVNLVHAVELSPMIGLGFGRPFQVPGQGGIPDVGFSLENVIPHNQVMWIWAKMGTIGFGLFWVMVGGIIAYAGVAFRSLSDSYARAVAALVMAAVAMQIVVSYVDLQLTYARNMVFLGVLVGVLMRLVALSEEEAADASG
jgi:hypothetical protein